MLTGTIEDNLIKDAASSGIEVLNLQAAIWPDHTSIAIRNNRVDTTFQAHGIGVSGAPGIVDDAVGGCLIIENTVVRAGTDGIYLMSMSGCKVHNNVLWGNDCNGILWLGGGKGLVQDNDASNNGLNGIVSGGQANHIDRNVMNQNECFGLYMTGSDSNYGRNSARLNNGELTTNRCANASCDWSTCNNPPPSPADCWPPVDPPTIPNAPPGPGNFPPEFCDAGSANNSFCDNLMPGPPPS